MIISHDFKYCYVELPHTASSAIARELVEHYGGISVLQKHSKYEEFLRVANEAERGYFVFSGIRNPMDEAVSLYFKYKNNHAGNYTNPAKFKRNGGHVSESDLRIYNFIAQNDASFGDFLRRFYRVPYDNWSALSHAKFDYVIRFEHLQDDFAEVLERIGIEQKGPLPAFNVTVGKEGDFLDYFTPDVQPYARRIFGPFMRRWGYAFPEAWGDQNVPPSAEALFSLLRPARRFRWKVQVARSSMPKPIPREAA
jgi:hypothetical protein